MSALIKAVVAILLAPITRYQEHKKREQTYKINYQREERKP